VPVYCVINVKNLFLQYIIYIVAVSFTIANYFTGGMD